MTLVLSAPLQACGGGEEGTPVDGAPASKADALALRGIDASIETYGHTATASQQAPILVSLRAFMAAKADGRYGRACELLIAFMRETLERGAEQAQPGRAARPGCAGALQTSLAPIATKLLRQGAQIDPALVKVKGSEAFVVYSTPGVPSQIMYMKREGGQWKVGKVNADRLL